MDSVCGQKKTFQWDSDTFSFFVMFPGWKKEVKQSRHTNVIATDVSFHISMWYQLATAISPAVIVPAVYYGEEYKALPLHNTLIDGLFCQLVRF